MPNYRSEKQELHWGTNDYLQRQQPKCYSGHDSVYDHTSKKDSVLHKSFAIRNAGPGNKSLRCLAVINRVLRVFHVPFLRTRGPSSSSTSARPPTSTSISNIGPLCRWHANLLVLFATDGRPKQLPEQPVVVVAYYRPSPIVYCVGVTCQYLRKPIFRLTK
jgi:hypothetical protein